MGIRPSWLFVVVIAGCGRIGFDSLTDGASDGGRDDGGVGSVCQTDGDCGPCMRCRAQACEDEPINSVFLGHQSTCFIGAEGSRWCTGNGNGVVTEPGTGYPVRREGDDGWTTLAPGFSRGFGTRGDELWGWLGSDAPTLVTTGNWARLTSENSGCWLDTAGNLDCSGPIAQTASGPWTWVDRGWDKQCAIAGGALYCWGVDLNNSLGQGVEPDGTMLVSPTQVGTDTDWVRVAIGTSVACAKKTAGTLYCWGRSTSTGTNGVDTAGVPTLISPDSDWTWVEAHWVHACAGKSDGRVFCWGEGDMHEVVPGMNYVPVPTELPGPWDELVIGGHHYCGRRGTQWSCWGLNTFGQLGVGGTQSQSVPTPLCGRS